MYVNHTVQLLKREEVFKGRGVKDNIATGKDLTVQDKNIRLIISYSRSIVTKLDVLMYILNKNYEEELHKNRKMKAISVRLLYDFFLILYLLL